MKILASTGIRSEYDILYPVISELKKSSHDVRLAVSGAHLSHYHNDTYKRVVEDGFEIADKIDSLLPTDRSVQRSKSTGLLIEGLSQTVIPADRRDFILNAAVPLPPEMIAPA